MDCLYCNKPTKKYGPLNYCDSCQKWFENGEKIEEVYRYCKTRETNLEKCNSFIQENLMMTGRQKLKEGEEIPIANSTLNNIYKADKICASCENYNFVLDD